MLIVFHKNNKSTTSSEASIHTISRITSVLTISCVQWWTESRSDRHR